MLVSLVIVLSASLFLKSTLDIIDWYPKFLCKEVTSNPRMVSPEGVHNQAWYGCGVLHLLNSTRHFVWPHPRTSGGVFQVQVLKLARIETVNRSLHPRCMACSGPLFRRSAVTCPESGPGFTCLEKNVGLGKPRDEAVKSSSKLFVSFSTPGHELDESNPLPGSGGVGVTIQVGRELQLEVVVACSDLVHLTTTVSHLLLQSIHS